jgi:hypothetical protein
MAEFLVHILQAEHNESLADYLIGIDPYHDWVITVSFYSAIHYFEARLFITNSDSNNKHSDTSMPKDNDGKPRYSIHVWREKLIHDKFPRKAWESFKNLKYKSEIARYLTSPYEPISPEQQKPSYEYFQPEDSRTLLKSLKNLKVDLKTDLAKFLYGLDMDMSQLQSSLVINKILNNLSSAQEAKQRARLRFLLKNELSFLENHLKSKGHELK